MSSRLRSPLLDGVWRMSAPLLMARIGTEETGFLVFWWADRSRLDYFRLATEVGITVF